MNILAFTFSCSCIYLLYALGIAIKCSVKRVHSNCIMYNTRGIP